MRLTGNQRYRVGFAGRVILQVEYEWQGMPVGSRRVGAEIRWRDAKVEDVMPTPLDSSLTTDTPSSRSPSLHREVLLNPSAAIDREVVATAARKALVENWKNADTCEAWNEDILLTGCRKAGGGYGYTNPEEAAQNLALDVADAVLQLLGRE